MKVDRDLVAAERLMQRPPLYDAAAFHFQQAAEKALKAYLVYHYQAFRKTHLLQVLVNQCEDLTAGFTDLLDAAATLTPHAVQSRYPDDLVVPTEEDAAAAREAARAIVAFVKERL